MQFFNKRKMPAQARPEKSFLCEQTQDLNEANLEFETLLNYLKYHRGYDLTGYRRSTLMRRFQHRMQSINIATYQNYFRYLQAHANESLALLDDVLINVTSFFRDRPVWDYLAAEIIPKIIASKQPNQPIRVWSAGCASGQEVYSLLILLAEAMGIEACLQRVECFATDAAQTALWRARRGIYSSSEISDIPPEWLEKYFQQTEKGYVFDPRLRSKVIFAHHDLTQDAPIAEIDLLICRNVLIYLNPDVQASILAGFDSALKNTGFLFLGQSETLVNSKQIFTPVTLRQRLYSKGLKPELTAFLQVEPISALQPQQDANFDTHFDSFDRVGMVLSKIRGKQTVDLHRTGVETFCISGRSKRGHFQHSRPH